MTETQIIELIRLVIGLGLFVVIYNVSKEIIPTIFPKSGKATTIIITLAMAFSAAYYIPILILGPIAIILVLIIIYFVVNRSREFFRTPKGEKTKQYDHVPSARKSITDDETRSYDDRTRNY